MAKLIAGTRDGEVLLAEMSDGGRDMTVTHRRRIGPEVTAVGSIAADLLVGTVDGIFRSVDGGASWQESSAGLALRHVRALGPANEGTEVLVGTEPAGIYVSKDRGRSWHPHPEVERMRDKLDWFLPYSPKAGCVRGFAMSDGNAYAAVEVGGVLVRSDDGSRWLLAAGSPGADVLRRDGFSQVVQPSEESGDEVEADVHSVIAPRGRVLAATSAGVFASANRGRSWELLGPRAYTRAVWSLDDEGNRLVAGPAQGVGRGGTIIESLDGGASWGDATAGLETPWPHAMVESFAEFGGSLVAVLSDGRALIRHPDEDWENILGDTPRITAVAPFD